MSGTFTLPPQASGSVGNPPVGYYRFFVGDGSDNTAGTYYKKDSSGVVTPLVPSGYTDEQAQDAVAAMLNNSDGTITLNYNDAGNVESISVGTILASKVSDFTEAVQDVMGATVSNTPGVRWTYNDALGTLEARVRHPYNGLVTGATKTYDALTDNLGFYERSNGGANMNDVLPALTASDNGIELAVYNIDPTGTITFTTAAPMAAATFGTAVGNTYVLQPLCRQTFRWTGTAWKFGAGNANLTKSPTAGTMAAGYIATYTDAIGRQLAARKDNSFDVESWNVLDHGLVAGNSALASANVTAWNAMMAIIPDNMTVYWPPGPSAFYVDSVLAIPGGKHLRQLGGGNQKTIISTTSATADIFTVGDWYNEFNGLKFTTTVTRTAGRAIYSGNNVACNVYNCDFDSQFDGLVYSGGANAGNLASVFNCNWTNGRNRDIVIDGQNANTIISQCVGDAALGQRQAALEINQCGSIVVVNCDFIRAVNNLKLNPSGTNGVFSAYFVNTFFDTSSASSVKFMGAGNIQRMKFVNCWFSGSVTGCEFNSTAGGATSLPTAIDFVNCDIFGNSSRGIYANGVQDFSVSNSRIAGNSTAGIETNASTGSVTAFNLQNNTIGPTAGFGANGTGVLINAGTYSGYNLTGNDVKGNSSNQNIVDNGTVATPDRKKIGDNLGHLLKGGLQSLTAASTSTAATITKAFSGYVPANAVGVGQNFRVRWGGLSSSTGTLIFRLHLGPLGTTADPTVWTSATSAAQVANQHASGDCIGTVRSTGSGGTVSFEGSVVAGGAAFNTATAAAVVGAWNTTQANFITLSVISSIGSFVTTNALLEAL